MKASNFLSPTTITSFDPSVVGVMETGNIVSRVGIEPTSLAIQAIVFTITPHASLMSSLYSHLPVYVAPCHPSRIVYILILSITYRQSPQIHIHRVGSTTIQHMACAERRSW